MTRLSRTRLALALLVVTTLAPAAVVAQDTTPPAAASELATEDDKMLYTVGLALAQNLGILGLDEAELAIVQRGIADFVLGRGLEVDLQTYGPKLQEFAQARMSVRAEEEKTASTEFLEAEAAKEGAVRTDSGLVITELAAGDGASPGATDTVKVHYHGTLRDGTVFDSSVDRGQPAEFALNQVIPCWTEGVQLMKVGGKSRLVCPSSIAYGDQGRPSIPGGAALVFEVELLEIVTAESS